MKKKGSLIFLFLMFIFPINAQEIFFQMVSEVQGLRSDATYDIDQDKQGNIWLAGVEGVSRFNGRDIRNFGTSDGWPVETQVPKIMIDRNNVLWVASRDSCVFIVDQLNHSKQRCYLYPSFKNAMGFHEEENGDVWVLTDTGLKLLRNYKIIDEIGIDVSFTDFCFVGDKIFMTSINLGLYIYDRKNKKVSNIKMKDGLLSDVCYSANYINEEIYIGHDDGYSLIKKDGTISQHLMGRNCRVTDVALDKNGYKWIITYEGMWIYKKEKLEYRFDEYNNKFRGSYFEEIFFDRENNIWLANNGGGGVKIKNLNMMRYVSNRNLEEGIYSNIQQNDSTYYQCFFGRNYFVKLTLSGHMAHYDTVYTKLPSTTYAERSPITNEIILTGIDGLVSINNTKIEEKTQLDLSNYFLTRPCYNPLDSTFYIGSLDGITKYKNGKTSKLFYKNHDSLSTYVYTIEVDSINHQLFIATNDRIKRVKNNCIVDIPEINYLYNADATVNSLHKDPNNYFWASINSNDVIRFWESNGKFNYRVYNLFKLFGLRGNFNFFSHGNTFWLRTQEKLFQLNLSSLYDERPIIENVLDVYDNIGPQVAYFTEYEMDNDGSLWMMGSYGSVKYDYTKESTNHIENINSILQLSIGGLYQYDQYFSTSDRTTGLPMDLTLPHKFNEITFDYLGVCQTSPKEVKYRTRLIGLKSDWSEEKFDTKITYNNLSPGTYTFQFISRNNDGVWSKEPYSFTFRILPAWYQTWWFKLIMAILIAGIVYLLFLLRINKLKNDKLKQEKLTQDILQSQEQERKRIAQELHDGVGQELSMLKVNVEKLQHPEVTGKVNKIIEDIRFLSRNIHPHYFEKLGLTRAIEMIIDENNKLEKTFWVHELENVDDYFNPNQQLMLYRVIQECINNTIKHSGAKNAKVSISNGEKQITIVIQDNGVGFVSDQLKLNSLGLSTIRERVRSLNGSIQIKSTPGKGTITEILLPHPNPKK